MRCNPVVSSIARAPRTWARSQAHRIAIWGALLAVSLSPARAADLSWLTAQQNVDGSYGGTPGALATRLPSTAEVLRAQHVFGEATTASFAAGVAFVTGSSDPDTELLSRKIGVDVLAGNGTATSVAQLLARQNGDGGFGDRAGWASSVLASSSALEALAAASYGSGTPARGAIGFLLARQLPNGGWADGPNDGSVPLTAQCLRALRAYRDTYAGVAAAISGGQGFLISRMEPGGLWGEDFSTAVVLLASAPSIPDAGVLDASAAALRARQLPDGSWADDAYTTALVLQALDAYDQRKSATPAPASGSIAGHVVRAGSTEPIVGAAITLMEPPGLSVLTNGEGYYVLSALPPGSYTVTAAMPGYAPASAIVTVTASGVTLAPDLVLGLVSTTGLVRGVVFDSGTRAAIVGAQLSLSGAGSRSVLTGAGGAFDFGPVEPGSYTLSVAAPGYQGMSGTAVVAAGQTLATQIGMTAAGGFVDTSPGVVRGRVVDGKTGAAVAGASFDLGGGLAAVAGADGAFAVASVPRGSYQGTVAANGYQAVAFTLLFAPGASGDVGTISIFPATPVQPPTTLTLHGLVAHGVTGAPVAGATVTLAETGASVSTGADGRFLLSGITLKSFSVGVAAAGFVSATYGLQVAAFGDANVTLQLSPPGSGATSSAIAGLVSDAASGAPVAGAVVAISGSTLSTTTGADGRYRLAGIEPLDFAVSVSAVGYVQQSQTVKLTAPGEYGLDARLQAVPVASFQVVSVAATRARAGGNETLAFDVRVASLLDASKSALLLGEVQDSSGAVVARVSPWIAGTTTPGAEFAFAPRELKALTVPWRTAQFAPGAYRLVLRVIEPGTISRAAPLGDVLAEGSGHASVVATAAIAGGLALDPPLTQAGLPTPVALGALVQNAGNVPLAAGEYELTVVNPATGASLHVATAAGPALEVSETATLAFGSWVPTDAGNLGVTVRRKAGDAAGSLVDTLYVGDRASGTFTVDRTVVPEGTQTVRGSVAMQGVDVSRGNSQDPLFKLVKDAVTRGGGYVATTAVAWDKYNRCNGCHIQSQSLLGLSSALDKATIDPAATRYLYNSVATGQYANGVMGVYSPHAYYQATRTILNAWSLGAWADPGKTFRTRYKAAQFLQSRRRTAGVDVSYWSPDHATGWWNTDESQTALTVKTYAGLVRDAARGAAAAQPDYAVDAGVPAGAAVQGMTAGPGGALYFATARGEVRRLDPASGAVTTSISGLPTTIQGVSFATDGTLYVTNAQYSPNLIRIAPDGTRTSYAVGGYLADVVVGPDGWAYAADTWNHRVMRVSAQGAVETFVAGGLLNTPSGLVFDEAGDLLVANRNGYEILRVAPDRSVSAYASGLAERPVRIARVADGTLYVTTDYSEANGGALRVFPDGTAERVLQVNGMYGVAAVGQHVYLGTTTTARIHRLDVTTLDTSGLAALRAEIPRGARFLLSRYTDNHSDTTVHALRLVGLAEARDLVGDAALVARIDAAVTSIASLLRARQRSDGGWARYVGYPSDPLSTAMAGIALEYTNPSASDPQIRAGIQYLLRTQRADGSWDNVYSGLSTRLASTSFVMVFMPKALERLGGIDIGLHLRLDWSVQLANPSQAPTTVTANADGTTDYLWQMQGVTSAGRQVDFDLTLPALALHEARPAARSATLEFANSFVDGTVQLPLAIPSVRAESDLSLAVATDRASYPADAPVAITSTVSNGGPTVGSGQVLLAIRPAGSAVALAELPPHAVSDLAPGAHVELPASWNTGATRAGSYEVVGRLVDAAGRVLSESAAPFRIEAPPIVAATSVATDKAVYGAWDAVAIAGRVQNASRNATLPPTRVELTVTGPAGATLLSEVRDVRELAPGGLADLAFPLALADAPAGLYPVTLVLQDRFTRTVLSTSTTQFEVRREALQGVSGAVRVAASSVYQGDPNTCTDVARNHAAAPVPGVTLLHRVVSADSGAVVHEVQQAVELPPAGQDQVYVHDVQTRDLPVGGYACLLLAQLDGVTRTLGSAGFQVLEPPVRFTAGLTLGGRGRLLVLLGGHHHEDHEDHEDDDGCDEHGERDDAHDAHDEHDGGKRHHAHHRHPKRAAERARLEELLQRDGWSYTIAEHAKHFRHELRSGGYRIYALFAEPESLGERTALELREAVFRGEGLVVVGHGEAHGRWRAALGATSLDALRGATGIEPVAGSPLPGAVPLARSDRALRLRTHGAEVLARYQVAAGKHHDLDGGGGCREGDDADAGGVPASRLDGTPRDVVASHGGDDGPRARICRYDAITLNAYGRGQAALAGADLLAIATRDPKATAVADDLLTLLHLVHPAGVGTDPGAVVPVQLTVANQGIAVPVVASVPVPTGARVVDPGEGEVAADTLSFRFPLAVGETRTVRFWLRLPDAAGAVTIRAVVSATHNTRTVTVAPDLAVEAVATDAPDALKRRADDLARLDARDAEALRHASKALAHAARQKEPGEVIEALLRATDALEGHADTRVVELRVAIDRRLRWVAMTAPHRHGHDR